MGPHTDKHWPQMAQPRRSQDRQGKGRPSGSGAAEASELAPSNPPRPLCGALEARRPRDARGRGAAGDSSDSTSPRSASLAVAATGFRRLARPPTPARVAPR
ncbi:hypothetical protein ZWY2020_045627 [Hordeum vulgare]|nr:hypothetical protein ZWY2020_011252 [Hordeum vulgare]KAI5020739.1 hypothetical protein ZWY2020_045627 [Hordeum vulgare]